jgi:hypothetical protein
VVITSETIEESAVNSCSRWQFGSFGERASAPDSPAEFHHGGHRGKQREKSRPLAHHHTR